MTARVHIMKNKLTEQILENYNCYKNSIVTAVEDFSYRKKRYGVDFTVALFISDAAIDDAFVQECVRDTDKVIKLNENFVAVVFDFATVETGLKAAENLMTALEPKLFDNELYVSVVNSENTLDDDEHIRKALDILIDNIASGYDRIPRMKEDESL